MSRSIIIEGADGHGKSTLTRRLATDLGYGILTCGPHPKTYSKYMGYIFRQRKALQTGTSILDRHTPMSTYAYSNINSQPVPEDAALQHARISIRDLNPVVILCETSVPDIDPDKSYKSEDYIATVDNKNADIVIRYKALFASLQLVVMQYDWQEQSYMKFLREVKYVTNT